MRIQQGPYIGEVDREGHYTITRDGIGVEAGAAETMKEAFALMEARIAERCKADRTAGRTFIPGDLKPFLVN